MNPPIPNIYKNDDIDIDNYTQAIQDNEIDKENEGKTFEEALTLLYSIHVKYVNELKGKYEHKLNYQKHLSDYNIQQLELDNKKLKLQIEQLVKQVKYYEEEPMKYNMAKNNEMKIVFEKELKHWQQQYHILKKHFKNYQVKAKERIDQWKKYSEYIKFENQKLQNEIISKLPDISRNNIDISMLSDMHQEKDKDVTNVNSNNNNITNTDILKKIKIEPNYDSATSSHSSKKRKYSSNDDQDIVSSSSSSAVRTPNSRILDGINAPNMINNAGKMIEIKKEEDVDNNSNRNRNNNNNNNNFYASFTTKKNNFSNYNVRNEFMTPKKKMLYVANNNSNNNNNNSNNNNNNRVPINIRQGSIYGNEMHPSSCTTVYDEGDNHIRILSSPTASQDYQNNKPSFMLGNNLTSTPNERSSSKEYISKKFSSMSLKENMNINNDEIMKESNDSYKFATNSKNESGESKKSNSNTGHVNSSDDETEGMVDKPLQKQNSMVLSKEQIKEMTKSKPKEKIRLSSVDGIHKKVDKESMEDDLKNAIVQAIDSDQIETMEVDHKKIKQEEINAISSESSASKSKTSDKKKNKNQKKKKKKKKKNILLSPSDKILKELCESSDAELKDSNLPLNDLESDDESDTDTDEDINNMIRNVHDQDKKLKDPYYEDEEMQLNSSQRSEEIIKNINIDQDLINDKSKTTVLLNEVKTSTSEEEEEEEEEDNDNNKKSIKRNVTSAAATTTPKNNNKPNKKSKSKPKKKRRETIIPETPSIRSDSEDDPPFSKILSDDGKENEEKKVYIWKTNYKIQEGNDDEIINNQKNETFMFDDDNDLDLDSMDNDHHHTTTTTTTTTNNNNNNNNTTHENNNNSNNNSNNNIIHHIIDNENANKKMMDNNNNNNNNNNKKKKNSILVEDNDENNNQNNNNIGKNNSLEDDVDIIEVIRNNNNFNNALKIRKTKQQTLFNFANVKSENNSVFYDSDHDATKSVASTPSKNLKLRKKKVRGFI